MHDQKAVVDKYYDDLDPDDPMPCPDEEEHERHQIVMPYYNYLANIVRNYQDADSKHISDLHAMFKKIEEAGDNFDGRPPSGHTHVRFNEDFSRLSLEFTDPQGQDSFWEWAIIMKRASPITRMMDEARAMAAEYESFVDPNAQANATELERVSVVAGMV